MLKTWSSSFSMQKGIIPENSVSEALVKAVIYAIDRGAFGNLCVFASVGEAVS